MAANSLSTSAHKFIPLADILDKLQKTKSMTDTAKILGCSVPNISKRLKAAHINVNQYLDYRYNKASILEGLQAEIVSKVKASDIQKASMLQKVTAVGILEDKIRLERGQSTQNIDISQAPELQEKIRRLNKELLDLESVIDVTPVSDNSDNDNVPEVEQCDINEL